MHIPIKISKYLHLRKFIKRYWGVTQKAVKSQHNTKH